jgi:hypothetical protein
MEHRVNKHENEDKRMTQLRERAMNDPLVHAQLVEMMEEDPDLIKTFSKHVQKKYGSQWDKLQPEEKNSLVKQEISKNRIPRKGGKKTKKIKNTKRKVYSRKNRKTKKRNMLKRK